MDGSALLMDLSVFLDVPFNDVDAFSGFLMANDLAHQAVSVKLQTQGFVVPVYPLSDAFGDMKEWLQLHNDAHQQELNLISGSAGQNTASYQIDMASVDLSDEQEYNDWMQGHGDIHAYVNSLLGL